MRLWMHLCPPHPLFHDLDDDDDDDDDDDEGMAPPLSETL